VIRLLQILLCQFNELLRKDQTLSSILDRYFFVNRDVVVIERDLSLPGEFPLPVRKGVRFIKISNSVEASQLAFSLGSYYFMALKHLEAGYKGFALIRGNRVLGEAWCSNGENGHPDLKWMEMRLGQKEAYMFHLYVRPEERVGGTAFILLRNTYNALKSEGITKVYGYCRADNLAARWVYKTLGCKELPSAKAHRFFFVTGTGLRKMFI